MRYQITETKNVRSAFIRLGNAPAVLYQNRAEQSSVAVVVMHSDSDYLSFSAGIELAERGWTVLCANTEPSMPLLMKMLIVKDAVEYLRALPGVEKVILFGHSGGATLMTAYQNAAENGIESFRTDHMIVKFPDRIPGPPGIGGGKPEFPPADGVMLVDPNWGNGAVALFSLDPAVVEEGNPRKLDPELDLFNPANGFAPGGSHYSDEFIAKFQRAQGARMNRLIEFALDRQAKIRAGKGLYEDDEPFLIVGGANNFMNNKLYAQDPRLLSRTKREYTLLKRDGERTKEIIHTVRKPQNDRPLTANYRDGLMVTTIGGFLDSWSVRTCEDFHYDESAIYGVDWDSSYATTTGNIKGVKVPLLLMGMTDGWEFSSVEGISERAASGDKTVAFVEGATHMYCPDRGETAYGDTLKTTYDFISEWLQESGRFV